MNSFQQSIFSVSEVELIYRKKIKTEDRHTISSSLQAYDVLIANWDMNKIELLEQFAVLLLDRNNACLGMSQIATGGVSACLVDPKIVFAIALKTRACSIVLAHNHPSGNLRPSSADEALTRRFKEAGKFLDINVPDHLIITPTAYLSFADEGLMPR